jgi:hypothetical protein
MDPSSWTRTLTTMVEMMTMSSRTPPMSDIPFRSGAPLAVKRTPWVRNASTMGSRLTRSPSTMVCPTTATWVVRPMSTSLTISPPFTGHWRILN